MDDESPAAGAQTVLLTPGERLGWVFRDRNLLRRRFPVPPPAPEPVPPHVLRGAELSSQTFGRNLGRAIGGTVIALGFVGCCGSLVAGTVSNGGLALTVLLTLVGLAGAVAVLGVVLRHHRRASAVSRVAGRKRAEYERRLAGWTVEKAAHDRGEQERCDQFPEWGAATTPEGARRIDIVGGSLWGWEGFLTVFGSSMLATRGPLTVVDLTGEAVSRELVELAAGQGIRTDVQALPGSLRTSDLLAGLDTGQFVDVIVEALHGGGAPGDRAGRMVDDRLLTSVCRVLGPNLTMGRLGAGLRLLLGEFDSSPLLTDGERRQITDGLFADEYLSQARSHLQRLEAFVSPLEELGVDALPRPPAELSCLALVSAGRSAHTELLNDLIAQWLTRRIAAAPEQVRTLVVAGADELARRHVERLSDVCERRDVRLALLFRHLRDTALEAIGGGGAVGFMKLGNHEEATRAADFIGRQHTFVLSQITRGLGGNETHTTGATEGGTEGSSGPWGLLFRYTSGWQRSRSWTATSGYAHSTNWTDTTTRQRVYEYAVEPRTLQDLPDYAMLLVHSDRGGSVLQAVDCNPAIATLPRVSMEALPYLPLPAHPDVTGPLPTQRLHAAGPR
jgi:hypothetical protein